MSTNSYWFKQKTDKLTRNAKKSKLFLFCLNGNKKHKETINISIEDQKLAQKVYIHMLNI